MFCLHEGVGLPLELELKDSCELLWDARNMNLSPLEE